MSKLREKINSKLEEYALQKALSSTIGNLGTYVIIDGRILYKITGYDLKREFKDNEVCELKLPSIDDIKLKIKSIYKNYDTSKLEDISYGIYDTDKKVKDKQIIIETSESILLLSDQSNFKSFIIKSANEVKLCTHKNLDTKYLEINANKVILRCNLYGLKDMKINAKDIEFDDVYFNNPCNVNIKSDNLILSCRDIICVNLNIDSKEILCSNSGVIYAVEKISITCKNCDTLYNVDSKQIIYNGQDITYSEGIILPKLRGSLIKQLKDLRNKCNRTIESQTKENMQKYKSALEKSPITKVLK